MGEFVQFSKEIIRDFIYNVTFADDRIEFISSAVPAIIHEPTKESAATPPPQEELKISEKAIDIKPLLDEFNAKGIPCSFLLLEDSKEPTYYTDLFFKTDAIILDWQINSDGGEYVLKLMKILLEEASNSLRVILIYTGNPSLSEIIKTIVNKFPNIQFVVDQVHGCSLRYKSTIISVFAKSGVTVDTGLEGRILNERQLVDSLIDEFLKITIGLVSNFALKSISIIRKNTHTYLSIFSKDLDPAFLAHRSLLANTNESEEQLIEIVGSEIKSLFYNDNLTKTISKEVIRKYLTEYFNETDLHFQFPFKEGFAEIVVPDTITRDDLIRFSEIGVCTVYLKKNTVTQDKILFSDNCHILHTDQFCHDDIDPSTSNISFALLSSVKTRFNKDYLPSLTLGSVVKEHKDGNDYYWLCIQPKCDCVRVEKSRGFLFIPLKVNANKKGFDIILKHSNEILYFDIIYTIHKSKFVPFKANEHRIVRAVFEDGKIMFNKGEIKMEWIAELKNDFAQQIANTFSSNLSRVGTNHSEWMRRS